jgi:hypothetical protein
LDRTPVDVCITGHLPVVGASFPSICLSDSHGFGRAAPHVAEAACARGAEYPAQGLANSSD